MDPYVYPGTDILKNLWEIREAAELSRREATATTRRLIELQHRPISGAFDARHLQAIHRHIFQDVFAWAGGFRTVNISKSGDPFAFHQHIAASPASTFAQLTSESNLHGLPLARFVERAAYYLGEINTIHPFREGNGRAQREFIRQLGLNSGWKFDWSRITRDQMIEASRRSLRTDNTALEQILRLALGLDANPVQFGNHTFPATGITAYLKNGGRLEVAQQIAAHESSRTTGLYDRRGDDVSLDEVERIAI